MYCFSFSLFFLSLNNCLPWLPLPCWCASCSESGGHTQETLSLCSALAVWRRLLAESTGAEPAQSRSGCLGWLTGQRPCCPSCCRILSASAGPCNVQVRSSGPLGTKLFGGLSVTSPSSRAFRSRPQGARQSRAALQGPARCRAQLEAAPEPTLSRANSVEKGVCAFCLLGSLTSLST